jgi:dissimilatory sulfite reductase (desulfoviridin) alpha/beta subunit
MVDYFRENAKKHERIGRMIDRIGLEEFKQAVLD